MTGLIETAGRPLGLSIPVILREPSEFDLPSTAEVLASGGDARIALDPRTAANKYGCLSQPDPAIAAFGSSTASTISEPAYAAADWLRHRLAALADTEPRQVTYAREMRRIRTELSHLCGVSGFPGLDIVFAASGTDLHLLIAQLTGGTNPGRSLAVMVEASETGTGVPAALAGCHFSNRAPLGDTIAEGAPVRDGTIEVAAVPCRAADGTPRSAAALDGEVASLVTAAAMSGRKVLLTLVDVSKTGAIVPSIGCALGLQRRFPQMVDVLVDACQFRLAPATLHAYLEQGFMVALTGSKFLSGPAFSGAVMVPGPVARRLRGQPLPPALRAYSARADWPQGWAAPRGLPDIANYGLLLRWEAALYELRAFHAVPDHEVTEILMEFAQAVQSRLATNPIFDPLPVPMLDRRSLTGKTSWDQIPTIFPFLLRRPTLGGGFDPLSRAETEHVFKLLDSDASGYLGLPAAGARSRVAALRCQVGQPVACGERDGVQVSALRLCVSARLVVEAAHAGSEIVISRAMAALDKVALLARESACSVNPIRVARQG